jgi:site-specific recombinase XerD
MCERNQPVSLTALASLPNIRFHDLRCSAATLLLNLNIHPIVVQEFLDHIQISITMDVFSHVLPGKQQDATRQLDAALFKQERLGVSLQILFTQL